MVSELIRIPRLEGFREIRPVESNVLIFSFLCVRLGDLGVSAVNIGFKYTHREDAENPEVA
jgi:hypothetical protein